MLAVPPSDVVALEARYNAIGHVYERNAELRMLRRSATPPSLAAAHASVWAPNAHALAAAPTMRSAPSPSSEPYSSALADARVRFT
eukprot:1823968-Pleurochrysis_carterae.AAC.1